METNVLLTPEEAADAYIAVSQFMQYLLPTLPIAQQEEEYQDLCDRYANLLAVLSTQLS